jgi:carboxypeptidase family protein
VLNQYRPLIGTVIIEPFFRWGLRVVVLLALSPVAASAQSAIAGTVRDTTGAVIPGVTVEAGSPALIERMRSAVTDDQGQYRIVDLRPGTYTVTFTLTGFSTVRREGLELPANFTAPVNAELRVGALAETVTVTGESPLVDVQTTARRQRVDQELLDSLPTARDFQSIGTTLPGVNMGWGADVGGSKSMLQGAVFAYGGRGTDQALEIDGQNVMGALGDGAYTLTYANQGEFQEMVYQVAGGAADTQSGGIQINMIPKEGGNQFKGSFLGLYSRTGFQADNITDALRARGFTTPERLARMWDVNGDVGGPIKRDRIWFYTSYRNWTYDTYVGNVFFPDGRQAIDDGLLQALSTRFTFLPSSRDKITFSEAIYPKTRNYHLINSGTQTPAGSPTFTQFTPSLTQVKWTSTPAKKILVEVGSIYQHYRYQYGFQPAAEPATCFTAYNACPPGTSYGAIAHRELLTGIVDVAPLSTSLSFVPKTGVNASVSYVTGAHTFKVGTRWQWGHYELLTTRNGDIVQNYRGGVPESVDVANTPVFANAVMNRDLGIYVQDSWTIRRLTLNPGLRFEQLIQSTAGGDSPAGRFVPARHFDAIDNLPNWKNAAPRFGLAYDLRGNGKRPSRAAWASTWIRIRRVSRGRTIRPSARPTVAGGATSTATTSPRRTKSVQRKI